MSAENNTTSISFPSVSLPGQAVETEPRGGPDADLQRRAQDAARAALDAPLPTAEGQERAKRMRGKLEFYYWLRSQRSNQIARGGLEGAVGGLVAKVLLHVLSSWADR